MEENIREILNDVNKSIIKFRGIYSKWSKNHNISYNEMLVLYTIRDNGYCTQKQICDDYLLPKQTINNTITSMLKRNLLEIDLNTNRGREKAYSLTKQGIEYASPLLDSMTILETKAIKKMGISEIEKMILLLTKYDNLLIEELDED